jgi:hypothetical protein
LAAVVALLLGALGLAPGVSASQASPAVATTDVVSWGNLPGFMFQPTMGPGGGVAITPTGNAGVEVLKSDGTVVGWDATNPPAGLSGVVKVVAKGLSFLALKSNGTVAGWTCGGCYMYPVPAGLTGVIDVAIGNGFGVALKSDGTVVAWGPDAHHETDVPVGLNAVVAIATGDPGYTVAIRADGTVVDWGYGAPAVPGGLSGVASVSAGKGFVLAVKDDHTVVAWGTDATGTAAVGAEVAWTQEEWSLRPNIPDRGAKLRPPTRHDGLIGWDPIRRKNRGRSCSRAVSPARTCARSQRSIFVGGLAATSCVGNACRRVRL